MPQFGRDRGWITGVSGNAGDRICLDLRFEPAQWLADAFGVSAYPRLFSVSNAWTVPGVAAGPLLIGIIYDFADYRFGRGLAVLLSLLALLLVGLADTRPTSS